MRHGAPNPLTLGPAFTSVGPAQACVGIGDCSCRAYSEYLGRRDAIARARDLAELDDLRAATERAWIRGDLADAERLALLELIAIRAKVGGALLELAAIRAGRARGAA